MVWDVSFTCDICGKTKGEANHWWMASLGPLESAEPVDRDPSFSDSSFGSHASGGRASRDADALLRFSLMRWHAAECRNPEIYHLCGQGCAMQAAERYMTEGAIDAEAHSMR